MRYPLKGSELKKYLNYRLAERRFTQKAVVLDNYPYHAFIDPSTVCNLRCPYCAINRLARDGEYHSKRLMKFDEFKHIMDMVGKYLFQLELYQYGEPLLNPDIYRMIEYTKKQYDTYTHINTNATILSGQNAERLVTSGLDTLTLSIDGASQETYSKYRVGGDFKRVLENVNLIVEAKKARNSRHPTLVWQFLLFRHNEHEVDKARSIASKMGIDIFWVGPAYVPPEDKDWMPSEDAIKRYGFESSPYYNEKIQAAKRVQTGLNICKWLWTHLVVTSDGMVTPCCRTGMDTHSFGNILEVKGFFDLWNNDAFRAARRFFITGKEQKPQVVCETSCPVINRSIVPLTTEVRSTWRRRSASRLYNVYKDLFRELSL